MLMYASPRHAALAAVVLLCLACGGSKPQATSSAAKSDAPPPSPIAVPATPQLYLQTQAAGDQAALQIVQINSETGKLQLSCLSALGQGAPTALNAFTDMAFNALGTEVYLSASVADADGQVQNALYSFQRDPVTGMLTAIDQDANAAGLQGQPTLGMMRSFVLDAASQRIFAAEQGTQASLVTGGIGGFSLRPGGGLSRIDAHSALESPMPGTDSRDFATDNYTLTQQLHPSGRFLYTLSPWGCGPMQFRAYEVDRTSGALAPLASTPVWNSPAFSIDLAMDPSGRMLIGLGTSGTLELFSLDGATGLPTPLPPLPSALPDREHTEQLLMHPSGRFFFVRHQDNVGLTSSMDIYTLDAGTGTASRLNGLVTGMRASAAALDPTGRWLVVLHLGTVLDPKPSLDLFYFDATTGRLSRTDALSLPKVKGGKLAFAPR
jgi:6-phosphogluconolactonase (cycloisomerase 2 family)